MPQTQAQSGKQINLFNSTILWPIRIREQSRRLCRETPAGLFLREVESGGRGKEGAWEKEARQERSDRVSPPPTILIKSYETLKSAPFNPVERIAVWCPAKHCSQTLFRAGKSVQNPKQTLSRAGESVLNLRQTLSRWEADSKLESDRLSAPPPPLFRL